MLCEFIGGGPEHGSTQDLADDVLEVRCVGLTPGFSEVYARDVNDPALFVYVGIIASERYVPGFESTPVPDWIKEYKGPVYDLTTLERIDI